MGSLRGSDSARPRFPSSAQSPILSAQQPKDECAAQRDPSTVTLPRTSNSNSAPRCSGSRLCSFLSSKAYGTDIERKSHELSLYFKRSANYASMSSGRRGLKRKKSSGAFAADALPHHFFWASAILALNVSHFQAELAFAEHRKAVSSQVAPTLPCPFASCFGRSARCS